MEAIWTGRLTGTFYGYAPGRTYELSDGSKWQQYDITDEPGCIEAPAVELLTRRGSGVIYLAVGGATDKVRVTLVDSPVRSGR
jgi:hypothetical protein